jgi:hypothetical protein
MISDDSTDEGLSGSWEDCGFRYSWDGVCGYTQGVNGQNVT